MPDGHAFDDRNEHLTGPRERPDLAGPSPTPEHGPGPMPGGVLAGDARLSMRASAAPILATLQRHAGNRAVVERLGIQRIPDGAPEGARADVGTGPTGDATAPGGAGGNQVISGDTVEINASNIVLNAASTRVNGLLQSDTLVTDTVIASTYTPGAGNLW
jgi:hypothetical protein